MRITPPEGAYAHFLIMASSDGITITEDLTGDYDLALHCERGMLRHFLAEGFVASSHPANPSLTRFTKHDETLDMTLVMIGRN